MDQPDASPVLEEANGSPLPSQRRQGLSLFFRNSEEETPQTLSEGLEEATGEQPSDPAGGSPSADWDSGSDESLEQTPTSSPASEAGSAKPLSKAALRTTVREGIGIGSVIVHKVAAKTEGQQLVGLYIADEEDQVQIGDPLAEIAHRHGGLAGGKVSPDTADFLRSMFGMANYITKQVLKVNAAREHDARAGAGAVEQPGATFHE